MQKREIDWERVLLLIVGFIGVFIIYYALTKVLADDFPISLVFMFTIITFSISLFTGAGWGVLNRWIYGKQ
jgi:hypothetical protein